MDTDIEEVICKKCSQGIFRVDKVNGEFISRLVITCASCGAIRVQLQVESGIGLLATDMRELAAQPL